MPTTIFVFRNEPTYQPYKRNADGKLMNVGGYFQPTPFGNFVTLDLSAASRPVTIVLHEYVHAVMQTTIGDLPLWLNEGLAEYFSTFQFLDSSSTVEVGHPIFGHLSFLERNGTIDWNDVFTTTRDSPTYNEGTRQGAFYAQSWLTVHYLMATDQRMGSFGRMLALLRAGRSTDEALEEALGMDLSTLAVRVDEYRGTVSGNVWWSLGEQAPPVEVATRDVTDAEILFELGNLLAHRAQTQGAADHLEAARAAGHPSGPIEAALGYAAYAQDDRERAEKRFRSAIEAGAAAAETYVLLAEIMLDRDRKERFDVSDPRGQLGEGTLEARRLTKSALEIDDDNFPALVTLADTYQFDPLPDEGILAAERARLQRPTSLELFELEVCLFAQAGRPREAWYFVTQQLLPRDRAAALRAADCYENGVRLAAWRREEAEGLDAAASLLEEAVSVMDPREARAVRLREFREQLMARTEPGKTAGWSSYSYEIRTNEGDNLEADTKRYNGAVRLANEGSTEQALPIFEGLAANALDPEIARLAADSATQLREAISARQQYERLRQALTLANEGRTEEALPMLRELRGEVRDPGMLRTIEQALEALGGN